MSGEPTGLVGMSTDILCWCFVNLQFALVYIDRSHKKQPSIYRDLGPLVDFDVGALVDLDVGDLVESFVPLVSEGDLVFFDILGPLVDFMVGDLVDFVVGDLVDLGDFKSLAMAVTQTRAKIRKRVLRENILKGKCLFGLLVLDVRIGAM
eukprot:scaffold133_cov115-Cylindrotheca_fusiformis.AAC.5